jgi:hypothetical protein
VQLFDSEISDNICLEETEGAAATEGCSMAKLMQIKSFALVLQRANGSSSTSIEPIFGYCFGYCARLPNKKPFQIASKGSLLICVVVA